MYLYEHFVLNGLYMMYTWLHSICIYYPVPDLCMCVRRIHELCVWLSLYINIQIVHLVKELSGPSGCASYKLILFFTHFTQISSSLKYIFLFWTHTSCDYGHMYICTRIMCVYGCWFIFTCRIFIYLYIDRLCIIYHVYTSAITSLYPSSINSHNISIINSFYIYNKHEAKSIDFIWFSWTRYWSKSYLMAFYKTFIDIFQIFSFNKVVFF